ncbi:ABC transporter substrate-binding protein [Pseudomonas sp. HR96]|uniref:ABC transporter substrate-binding protein n=1 Tax=Pseudomonas sp. HR96 TaxID=1027966 RepID=UPI002A761D0E|nr:ABC transporter substrate-binding protein [Pseudomonas sp. HR96]WPP02046.1 ABC transporter substrate-binding protein [Pseudomonas sp. HR96]
MNRAPGQVCQVRRRCLIGLAALLLLPRAQASAAQAPLSQVAALDWGLVQTLLALGLTPAATAENALYRSSVREPQLPASVLELGLRSEPNLELLQELQPELILLGSDQAVLQDRLASIAASEVFETDDQGSPCEQVARLTLAVAHRIGRSEAAQRYLAHAWASLAEARQRCLALAPAALQVISVIDERRAMVFGRNSLFDDVLQRLGQRNAWVGQTNGWGFATIGFEQLAEQPEARLVYFNATPGLEQRLADNPLWRNLPSVRRQQAIKLPEVLFYGAMPSAVSFAELLSSHLMQAEHG